ncbi:hypothetical protein ACJX0J_025096, partial [Zea mays]
MDKPYNSITNVLRVLLLMHNNQKCTHIFSWIWFHKDLKPRDLGADEFSFSIFKTNFLFLTRPRKLDTSFFRDYLKGTYREKNMDPNFRMIALFNNKTWQKISNLFVVFVNFPKFMWQALVTSKNHNLSFMLKSLSLRTAFHKHLAYTMSRVHGLLFPATFFTQGL